MQTDERLVYRLPDLMKAVGLGKTTIYRKMKEGTFPKPVLITEDRVGWRACDVRAWLNSRPTVE